MRILIPSLFLLFVLFQITSHLFFSEEEGIASISILFFVFFFAISSAAVMYGASMLEDSKKVKQMLPFPKQQNLTLLGIVLLTALLALFYTIKMTEETIGLLLLLFLFLKFPFALFVAEQAEDLGRNKMMWGLLGLIEHHGALIVLGMAPRIFNLNKENEQRIEEFNATYKEKIETIEHLYAADLLTWTEKFKKIRLSKKEYRLDVEKVFQEIADLEKQNEMSGARAKLEKAYSNGLFTKEEFERKLEQIDQATPNPTILKNSDEIK